MVAVGSHGAGGGSASQAGNIAPAWSKDERKPDFPLHTADPSEVRASGPAQGGSNGDAALSTRMQKARDFDAMHGRNYNLFGAGRDKGGDIQVAQAAAGTMSDGVAALPGARAPSPGTDRTSVGLETAGGSDRGANGGLTKVIPKVVGKATGVIGGLVIPSNRNHDQILTIPGQPQYRITGKESDVGRTLEVQNADGSWEAIGDISVTGDRNGTHVDMTKVNDVLADRGFDPIGPVNTTLPGTPIDGRKTPTTLSTPDYSASGPEVLATPNNGARGAEVISTPIHDEQGAQILEAVWSSGRPGSGVKNAHEHWDRHKNDYPDLNNAVEYTKKVVELRDNPPPGTLEKSRSNGELVKYDPSTNDFAVYEADGTPKTLFKPDPSVHGRSTNLDYFNDQ